MKYYLLLLPPLLLSACGHEFTRQTYKIEGGRNVGEWFSQGQTSWRVGAEFTFDKSRR